MSDLELIALERAYKDDPSLKERVEAARLRHGLGWHGERMPSGLAPADESGVYVFGPARIQLVYVPGGEVECDHCDVHHRNCPVVELRPNVIACAACRGSGRRKIASAYMGRYPVTIQQAWVSRTSPAFRARTGVDISPERRHHPITRVSLSDAKAFCEWSGLSLPTAQEWRWAALGPPDQEDVKSVCPGCNGPLKDPRDWTSAERLLVTSPFGLAVVRDFCVKCGPQSGMALMVSKKPRRYPWGNEEPTRERCWARIPDPACPSCRGMGSTRASPCPRCIPSGTAPVVEWLCPKPPGGHFGFFGYLKPKDPSVCVAESLEAPSYKHGPRCRLVPARPQGASWRGVQDAFGNVFEWISDPSPAPLRGPGQALGGSFRSSQDDLTHPGSLCVQNFSEGQGSDDVGFRVILRTEGT